MNGNTFGFFSEVDQQFNFATDATQYYVGVGRTVHKYDVLFNETRRSKITAFREGPRRSK